MASYARRCLRRDVDAHPSFTWQRPAPGRRVRMARDPGGPLRPLPPRRPAMEPVCGNRPEGSRCERRCPGNRTRREAKASQRDKNRRHAGAARQPGDPPRVSGSPTGFPGRPAEAFRAGSDPALGCRCGARGPVAPSQGFCGGDGACDARSEPDVVNGDCLCCRTGRILQAVVRPASGQRPLRSAADPPARPRTCGSPRYGPGPC